MSMRPHPSPMPALSTSRQSSVRPGLRFAPAIALGMVLGSLSVCPVARAEVDLATIGANGAAFHALMDGRVDDASTMLRATLAANPQDSTAHQLLCRVYYAEEQADDAIHQCELAAATAAGNNEASDNQLWLGRAYGMKARHAGPIAGYGLARKVQASFARAVDLNPANVAALSDLGEYDVDAPFIVGGGNDKATALAARMMPRFPAEAHRLLGRLADSENDLPTAEAEFKRALAVRNSPEAWIDLAQFYQGHSRSDDALAAVKSAVAADRLHGPALVDAASILTTANRAPDLAERCLRTYLASTSKSDAAPAFKVHLQLSKLLAARGDTQDATQEAMAASALATTFARNARPAQGRISRLAQGL